MDAVLFGSGWRARFYMRIAEKLPELLRIRRVHTHSEERAVILEKEGYDAVTDIDEALSVPHDVSIVSTSPLSFLSLMLELKDRKECVIAETSFLRLQDQDLSLLSSMKGMTAEQYPYTPLYASVIEALPEIGPISQVRIAGLHNHHAAAIARRILSLGNAMPDDILSYDFPYAIARTGSREGLERDGVDECVRKLRILSFGSKLLISDFSSNQYHSSFYSKEIEVRGERGVITESGLVKVNGSGYPVTLPFVFHSDDYHAFRGTSHVSMGDRVLWANPFYGSELPDDHAAIADMLRRFSAGEDVYTMAEGVQDARLGRLL